MSGRLVNCVAIVLGAFAHHAAVASAQTSINSRDELESMSGPGIGSRKLRTPNRTKAVRIESTKNSCANLDRC